MPRPKSRSTTKAGAKPPRAAALRLKKPRVKTSQVKSTEVKGNRVKSPALRSASGKRRMRDGIPLKRKVVWTYDTDSPEFKAAWKRDMEKIKAGKGDGDGMQFIDAVLDDPDVQRWWK